MFIATSIFFAKDKTESRTIIHMIQGPIIGL